MIEINFNNIENLLFENSIIRNKLICHKSLFDDWLLSKKTSNLNRIKELKIILLNCLDEQDLKQISLILNEEIYLEKITSNLTKDFIFNLSQSFELCDIDNLYKDYCLTRDKNSISIAFWR